MNKSAHVSCALLLILANLALAAMSPNDRERAESADATGFEQNGQWSQAGEKWEQAMADAEAAGEFDVALAHAERALAAWAHEATTKGLDRQAFVLGSMAKMEIHQGRLALGRERNLASQHIILERINAVSEWQAEPGKIPPSTVPEELLEAWARSQRDTANWLDAQGRTLEGVDLLNRAIATMQGSASGASGRSFYLRRLISVRAEFKKFLGFEQEAITDLKQLADLQAPDNSTEWVPRFNLAYFSSQFYGPKPEYLAAAQKIQRDLEANGEHPRDLRRLMAKMASNYEKEAAAAKAQDLAGILGEAKSANEQIEAIYTQRDLALLNSQSGTRTGVEEALLKALADLRAHGIKRGEPTLYREYGTFLMDEGNPAEGLRMTREALRLTRVFGWTQHIPPLLMLVARAQAALGDLPGLAQTLADLDAVISSGKLTPMRSFMAHCARAHVLLLLDRKTEAESALTKAKEVAAGAGLNDYQRSSLAWAKATTAIAKNENPPQGPTTSTNPSSGKLDLEPIATIATAAPGQKARARFRLSNSTPQLAQGTLALIGPEIGVQPEEASGIVKVTLRSATTTQSNGKDASLPVQLRAGEDLLVEIEADVKPTPDALRISWKGNDSTSATAECFIRPESADVDAEAGTTVADSSVAYSNPFYAVHLFHPVHSKLGGVQSFRVLPSRPCRVELLEANTGALLAVDANGDGDFHGLGDSIAVDGNADGFPDLPTSEASAGIEILVFPLPGQPLTDRDTRIELQVKSTSGWKTLAHDTLKASRRP